MPSGRATQPLCVNCSHPRSFHGVDGRCKALGCTGCISYVSPLVGLPPEAASPPSEPEPQPSEVSPYSADYVVHAAVGQVWEDKDRRNDQRRLRIDSIEGEGDEAVAHVTWLASGKQSKIKVRRLRPTSNGYRLVG